MISHRIQSRHRTQSKMYILLYLEFYAPTFTSAKILQAAELFPSSSVSSPSTPGMVGSGAEVAAGGVSLQQRISAGRGCVYSHICHFATSYYQESR